MNVNVEDICSSACEYPCSDACRVVFSYGFNIKFSDWIVKSRDLSVISIITSFVFPVYQVEPRNLQF